MKAYSTREISRDFASPYDHHVSQVVSFSPQLTKQETQRGPLSNSKQGGECPEVDEHKARELNALLSKEVGDGDKKENRKGVSVNQDP
jgi:hypothetical protein